MWEEDEEKEELEKEEGWEEKAKKAGEIAWKALVHGKGMVKAGARLFDVAESVEKMIHDSGAKPAFPVNISIDEVAAHYTPSLNEETIFKEKDMVKLDVGVQVDGYIGDCAATVDLGGENGKMVEAAENALQAAIDAMKPGVEMTSIGEIIENEIQKLEFRPIENLSGHKIEKFILHSGVSVPNVKRKNPYILKEGDLFAIEPFVSRGRGSVAEGERVEIFSFIEKTPVRMREARRVQQFIESQYPKLPFAERWLMKKFERKYLLESALKELAMFGCIRSYPILKDDGLVAQAEKTVLIGKEGAIVTTK